MNHSRLTRAAPYALYALIALWYCRPLFISPNGLGVHDWDQHLFYYGSVVKSLVEYGQLPFWNPWYCGGNVLWQNPQVPLLSPALPLALVMSLSLAMKINIALHYWVGLCGMHRLLTRGIGVRSYPVTCGLSVIATCSGALAMHLAVGHSVFLPVVYLPWQMLFVIQGIRTGAVRDIVLAAIPFALMIYNGALHAVPMSVAAVGGVALCAAVGLRKARPIIVALAVGVLGAGLAAPKLIPVALFVTSEQFADVRTVLVHPDAMSGDMVTRAYVDRYQDRSLRFDHQRSGWFEYGNYIGGVAAAAIAASILFAFVGGRAEERWIGIALALTSVLFLLLSAGEFSPYAPASLAAHIPLFSNFRIPSRYTFGFVLCAIAAVGWAWRVTMGDVTLPRSAAMLFVFFTAAASFDVAARTREQFPGVFEREPLNQSFKLARGTSAPLTVDTTTNAYGADSPMLRGLMNDVSFWDCYESLQLKRTATPDHPLIDADASSRVTNVRFSPNRIDFAVVGGREATLIRMNQNGAPGWTSTLGPVAVSDAGGMHAPLTPGQAGTFSFRFVPPGLYAGIAVAILAVMVALGTRNRNIPDR